jgi:outer membrane protein OmpA-like peptidoglycan-associated protein
MEINRRKLTAAMFGFAGCGLLLSSMTASAESFVAGKKAKVTGTIQSRNGDLINLKVKKTGEPALINLTDSTKIERKKDFRLRRTDMDVTAMVPGLTIDVDGIGNANGQLDASKIEFDPNVFAIEVAEEQQIEANQSAAARAQSTANQGVSNAARAQASANNAQASANQAQVSANQAGNAALAAGAVGIADAQAIQQVNTRVSDLGDYKTVGEAAVFFNTGQDMLSDADKAALSKLASDAATIPNYLIEVAGYASSTGTKAENLKISDGRATVVADYLRNTANVPMRRILMPAGYGATHPAVSNQTTEGQDINQRVDVKVLVNKGLAEGS